MNEINRFVHHPHINKLKNFHRTNNNEQLEAQYQKRREKIVHSNINLKRNAMSSSPQVIAKQTVTVYLGILTSTKDKISPQKDYNTEKNQKITRIIRIIDLRY